MRERGRALSAALCLAMLLHAAPAAGQTDPRAKQLCGEANGIAKELTQISGMPLRHPVPCDFITKEKINDFLKKRVKDVASPEEIRAEELTLKKFGLVPQDFDLAKNTVDLLTEQAAAFYDYDKKKLFITESTPSENQEPVLAHELSHALADQSFNLAKFIRQGRKSDDGATARLAVMEGQATWMMSEYLARKSGQSLKDSPELVATMSNMSETGGGQYPVYESAPLYLRLSLVFPYTKGMLFQNAVFQRDGQYGFAAVFRRPPLSTQQILHPEKYFANVKPTEPDLPDPHLPRGYKGLVGGSLGELEHGILLEQYAGKERAAEIAPHWRGCTFELRENKKAGRVVLLYAVDWDSEEAARQYFAAYRELLGKKWKNRSVASEDADSVVGTGDDGGFELRRKGAVVTSVEGLDPGVH
ncbi:conserved exported hypothetical protein [Candidatus Sulfopaludibacter sp. SbA6]|nr:conserved exported hypothetical protein [Candidatus Sulfopaludibacter sp. SbA6]